MIEYISEGTVENAVRNVYMKKTGRDDLIDNWKHTLIPLPNDKDKFLFFDNIDKNALLVTKIDIKELINFKIDITGFKNKNLQLPLINDIGIEKLESYGLKWKKYKDETDGVTVTLETYKKFATFKWICGLTDLMISDVSLQTNETSLTIVISEYHPYLRGEVTITTW